MVPSFENTTRAIRSDRSPAGVLAVVALVFLLLWGAWARFGQLTLYEASTSARVVARGAARLRVPAGGVVVAAPFWLGDRVEAGATLLQLDDREARLLLGAARARREGLSAQIAAITAAGLADAAGRDAGEAAGRAAMGAATASLEQARVRAQQSRDEVARLEDLVRQGAASAAELDAARAELAVREAQVRVLEEEAGQNARLLRREALLGEAEANRGVGLLASLQADLAAAEAEETRLEAALAERAVLAPGEGLIGERGELEPGQRVEAGALVAVLVPDGPVEVEARLPPERAIGRVRPGQEATVRVLGAAGPVGPRPARVARVGQEAGPDGLVPVILELESPGPEQHGQVVEAQIAVETLSPLTLLSRAAGQASGQ